MKNLKITNQSIKEVLASAKTIAMVGVSSIKKEDKSNLKRRPSIIVMKYLQEFGYRVIPINPSAVGNKINGENAVARLEDVTIQVDIVNVFRPSQETPSIAREAIRIGAKVLWLQYGIQNREARDLAESAKVICVENKCIKQEYQKLFQKMSTVFPVLQ